MTSLIATYGLPIVALIIFAGEIGLPTLIPGEIGLLLAGNQAIHSVPMLLAAIVVFGIVDIIATSVIHVAARTGGNKMLRLVMKHVGNGRGSPEAVVQSYRQRLGGRDSVVVFCMRLIPIFRLYASIATGLIKIDYRKFLTGAAPAAWLWAAIPLTAGYVLRPELGSIMHSYSSMMPIVVAGSVAVTGLTMTMMWVRSRPRPVYAVATIR